METYFGMVSLRSTITEDGHWFVFGKTKEGVPTLLKIKLVANYEKDALNFKTLTVEVEGQQEIKLDGNTFAIASNGNYIVLASDKAVQRVDPVSLKIIEKIDVSVRGDIDEL